MEGVPLPVAGASLQLRTRVAGKMSVEREFETVDRILASQSPTRCVDAFALSLIKAERQVRKLFTHLVYQSPVFGGADVPALRAVLVHNRQVYLRGFLRGFDALYKRSVESLVGLDYQRLKTKLDEAIDHRNKIFHGQLTSRSLRATDLMSLLEDTRLWCTTLANSSGAEVGYDGFGRNSFQKSSIPDLWTRYRVQLGSIADYEAFVRAHMER
jgi:hypothetical protein